MAAEARIGAILLAAGASRRMGAANKLLLPVDGVPMVARVAATISRAGLPTVVVLGHEAERVRAALLPSPAAAGEGQALQRPGEGGALARRRIPLPLAAR